MKYIYQFSPDYAAVTHSITNFKYLLVNLPLSFMYLKPKQVIRAWSQEMIEFDTEDQVLSSVCLFYDDLVIVSG